jgi:hypothetical protein
LPPFAYTKSVLYWLFIEMSRGDYERSGQYCFGDNFPGGYGGMRVDYPPQKTGQRRLRTLLTPGKLPKAFRGGGRETGNYLTALYLAARKERVSSLT